MQVYKLSHNREFLIINKLYNMGACIAIQNKQNSDKIEGNNTLGNSRMTDGSTTACHECHQESQKDRSRLSKKRAELPKLQKGIQQKNRILYLSRKIDYKNSLATNSENCQKLLPIDDDVQNLKLVGHKSSDIQKNSNVVRGIKAHLQKRLSMVDDHITKKNNLSFSCQICSEGFDISNQLKIPMIVCVQQHSVCMGCIKKMVQSGKSFCPLDKRQFDINSIKRNEIIIDIISHI